MALRKIKNKIELAKLVGVSKSTLSRVLNEDQHPSLFLAFALRNALEIPDDLFKKSIENTHKQEEMYIRNLPDDDSNDDNENSLHQTLHLNTAGK